MAKSFNEKVADFAQHWSPEQAGQFEFQLSDGQRIVAYDCHLHTDLANQPEWIAVNTDTEGQSHLYFHPEEVAAIVNLEECRAVIEK